MRGKTGDIFTTIRTEGALLPAEILRRIVEGDRKLEGLDPESYHLEKSEKINEAVNRAWFRCLGAWRTFRAAAEKLTDSDAGTTLTRERWLLILFQELGYGRLLAAKAQEIGGNTYPISHLWHHTPIHLVSFRQDLDRRTPGVAGAARLSPHSLVQEFLNRSENHLWGVVSNGHRLRILRDNISLTRQAYVDFDLEALMEGEIYPDFVLLYLLLHQSRLEADKPEECRLEKWSREAQERGTRALDRLRDGVEQAITALGQGFLAHPENTALRRALQTGTLSPLGYYQQLLRLIYRFIFLFVAEDRGLIPLSDISADVRKRYAFYAIARLRRLAGLRRGTRHGDLYAGLRVTFACLEKGEPSLGIPALNGFLFSPETLPDLNGCKLANDALLSAIRGLCYTEENRILRPVDYCNLGTEELGSVYESLLELHPELNADAFTFVLKTFAGSERKTTGSYYTHPSLIRCLLDSALEPLLDEVMKKRDPEKALLALKVADLACGSGHFLIAAAHRIAKDVAVVRTGEGEPPLEALRESLRDVIANCIYGVDINPLAVELCKVALWLESLDTRKPLGFLDHRIKCGNSIIGATPELLKEGIPDDAFKPVEGDDPAVASSVRRKNKEERKGQQDLFMIQEDRSDWREAASAYATWASLPENNIEQVSEKARQYDTLLDGRAVRHQHDLADLWTAAFFWPLTKETYDTVPTQDIFRRLRDGAYALDGKTAGRVKALADEHCFFHWDLEYPEVFLKRQGFDCVLGNPPWGQMELAEKEFFAHRDPIISIAPNAAARKRLISKLSDTNPILWQDFLKAKRMYDTECHFLDTSGRYPLNAFGRMNSYQIFAGFFRSLLSDTGRAGVIVPTGIATDDTNKQFFADLTEKKALVSLYDFENREKLFPDVDSRMKFCLLTMGGLNAAPGGTDFAFFLTNAGHLHESDRHFKLSAEDITLLNPNTRTCPIFRSKRDAEITKAIHNRIPILMRETQPEYNPWSIRIRRIFNMGLQDVSALAITRNNLEEIGIKTKSPLELELNDGTRYVPMFEGKMFDAFNHRAAGIIFNKENIHRGAQGVESTLQQLSDPYYFPDTLYWFPKTEMIRTQAERSFRRCLFGFKDISSATNERTMISSILPFAASNFTIRIVQFWGSTSVAEEVALLANFNSFVFDYLLRQSLGGLHISDYITHQIPVLPPERYTQMSEWSGGLLLLGDCLLPRVLELTYTAWDMEPFAKDCGYAGPPFIWDEERRFKIRCELDALYFHLYGINRDDADYILETFPIVKRKDIAQYGEYRTKNLILEIYDAMQRAKESDQPYQTILDPPPADPRVAHSFRQDG